MDRGPEVSAALVAHPGGTTTFGSRGNLPDTLDDRRHFLTDGYASVECGSCGADVMVRKTSREQTAIQWHSDPATVCPAFQGRSRSGRPACAGCPRLAESISAAVKLGLIPIGTQEHT
ncbi:hypothetical protein P0W64_14115 [Tsukamurella sp. 8F]|uniref:hypothetical protein n=1 Tax=unclassified Tsukamurella TaxID=2633480 RepID=UPI0023BA1EFF|nr:MULTISPECIES: hypothetical protein [unclassified Tsukamurella]MDF0530709.1 hypothetical protein [Tsukamurella sp. 8J]MDF0587910.1 hypothetical protein [Tsukamurella sp. 8F]